jgi:hypothetical protein
MATLMSNTAPSPAVGDTSHEQLILLVSRVAAGGFDPPPARAFVSARDALAALRVALEKAAVQGMTLYLRVPAETPEELPFSSVVRLAGQCGVLQASLTEFVGRHLLAPMEPANSLCVLEIDLDAAQRELRVAVRQTPSAAVQ